MISSGNFDEKFTEAVNRIIIGDVGSGKTIVAFLIGLTYLKGLDFGQVAMLAPTEVLAYQHYQKLLEFKNLLKENDLDFDFYPIFLTSKSIYFGEEKVTKKGLENKLKGLENEEAIDSTKIFWLGTHALLYNEFLKPDMVMIDEQHRFGVKQRQALSKYEQGENSAHFISFTATPIPRTLALTIFKTLEPIFLQKLEDRNSIETSIKNFETWEESIVREIQTVLDLGQKVYVVCSRVEDSEEEEVDELWSVKKAGKFFEKHFPDQTLIVHGKMASKKDILSDFKDSKEKNILVATTVIEVGVDVSEATLVIVLNAERFGLSALHQIRGRVGRNDYENNKCVLVTYKKYSYSKRIRFLCESNDGFSIAEKDLELRGSGDLIGTNQSGFEDGINEVIGLNPKLYYQISEIVEGLDFEKDLNDLPRLRNYLEKKSKEVWAE